MSTPRPARRFPRRSVELEASVILGKDLLVGSVFDLSPRGAFFRPEAGVVEGAFTQLDPRRPPLGPNDQLRFAIQHRSGSVDAVATVRWVGRSELHGTSGVGLEFNDELHHAALLPKLD